MFVFVNSLLLSSCFLQDDSVDIETVEEARQRNTIDEMRAAARRLLSGTQ